MIYGKKVLAVIPARGGSKGIPRKNIFPLKGKPLIAWTIEEAQKSQFLDKIIVSTDDEEIAEVSREWGGEVPFLRPKELAKDDTPGVEPILHALSYFPNYEYVVILQPTSPLRTAEDIDSAIVLCNHHQREYCVSVTESKFIPEWLFYINNKDQVLEPVNKKSDIPYQRQKVQKSYVLNGAVYVAKVQSLIRDRSFLTPNTIPYVMPSVRSVDIDDMEDLLYCEYLLSKM